MLLGASWMEYLFREEILIYLLEEGLIIQVAYSSMWKVVAVALRK